MSSADGIGKVPPPQTEPSVHTPRRNELKSLAKTAEDYVAIENRLAAQNNQPAQTPQLNSIFDQLRGRLPKS